MHKQIFSTTLIASGTGVQRRFIGFDGATAGANAVVAGVAMTDFKAGDAVNVAVMGEVAVESGGAVAKGAPVISDAIGRGIADPAADPDASVNRVGRALNAVTGPGQTLFILIR